MNDMHEKARDKRVEEERMALRDTDACIVAGLEKALDEGRRLHAQCIHVFWFKNTKIEVLNPKLWTLNAKPLTLSPQP